MGRVYRETATDVFCDMLADAALALERLRVRRAALTTALIYADAFERWGPRSGPEFDRMTAEVAEAQREYGELTSLLATLLRETWARDPTAVSAWADAHVSLLEHAAASSDSEDVRRAARGQIEAWRKVAGGLFESVDEGGSPVEVDGARYAAYFGAAAHETHT